IIRALCCYRWRLIRALSGDWCQGNPKPFSGIAQCSFEIAAACAHPQIEQAPGMLPRIREVSPKASLLSGNADFETLAWFAFNTADAPMIALAMAIREKICGQFFDAPSQLAFYDLDI